MWQMVFGILGFVTLGLSWVVAGLAMALGTVTSDFCVAAYAVTANTFVKAGISLPANIEIPELPDVVKDVALTCPEEWFGTQPSLEFIYDLVSPLSLSTRKSD